VQRAPWAGFPAAPEGLGVQSVIRNVHVLHGVNFIMHIFGGLA